jgi:hypothetical protein
MTNQPFYPYSSRNPFHLACEYFQILRKLYFDSSSMYSFFIVINIGKFVGCKVFSMHFNFSQWSTTLRWGWKKYILCSTFEHLGVCLSISHSSSKSEDNQRFSCEDVYILDVLFHL